MTPNLLRRVGEALFGERWQSSLARDLAVSDRTMRRWAAGDVPIPHAVAVDLVAVLVSREAERNAVWQEVIALAAPEK